METASSEQSEHMNTIKNNKRPMNKPFGNKENKQSDCACLPAGHLLVSGWGLKPCNFIAEP